jgi:hypothetical protein
MTNLNKGILALVVIMLFACKKPTENLKIVVDTNIIKFTRLIHVSDPATGLTPPNLTMTVGGASAANIYELSGKKSFNISSGIITIGPGPGAVPTDTAPVTCTVTLSAPGYNTLTQTITFTTAKPQDVVDISLVKTGNTTPVTPLPPLPVYNPTTLNFTGTCTSRQDIQIRPSVYVYFRETGSNAVYRYLGYMDRGMITTSLLALGKTYDFQIAFGGEVYSLSQKIEQASYDLTLNMGAACNNF